MIGLCPPVRNGDTDLLNKHLAYANLELKVYAFAENAWKIHLLGIGQNKKCKCMRMQTVHRHLLNEQIQNLYRMKALFAKNMG